jgi:transporter family-2 protein
MFYLLVVGAGISIALQQVLNANLRMELGSPWWAGFVSYLVGTIFMLPPYLRPALRCAANPSL